jgi:hypothetical protein
MPDYCDYLVKLVGVEHIGIDNQASTSPSKPRYHLGWSRCYGCRRSRLEPHRGIRFTSQEGAMNRREFLTYASGAVVGVSLSRMDQALPWIPCRLFGARLR